MIWARISWKLSALITFHSFSWCPLWKTMEAGSLALWIPYGPMFTLLCQLCYVDQFCSMEYYIPANLQDLLEMQTLWDVFGSLNSTESFNKNFWILYFNVLNIDLYLSLDTNLLLLYHLLIQNKSENNKTHTHGFSTVIGKLRVECLRDKYSSTVILTKLWWTGRVLLLSKSVIFFRWSGCLAHYRTRRATVLINQLSWAALLALRVLA